MFRRHIDVEPTYAHDANVHRGPQKIVPGCAKGKLVYGDEGLVQVEPVGIKLEPCADDLEATHCGDSKVVQLDTAVIAGGESVDDALAEYGFDAMEVDGECDEERGEKKESKEANAGSDTYPEAFAPFRRGGNLGAAAIRDFHVFLSAGAGRICGPILVRSRIPAFCWFGEWDEITRMRQKGFGWTSRTQFLFWYVPNSESYCPLFQRNFVQNNSGDLAAADKSERGA